MIYTVVQLKALTIHMYTTTLQQCIVYIFILIVGLPTLNIF